MIPSELMAPISKWCEERWLVNVIKEDQVYPASVIGKAFINEIRVKEESGEKVIETEILIESKTPIALFPNKVLPAGYYRVTVESIQRYIKGTEFNPVIERLNESQYLSAKDRKAHLLSYDNAQPAAARW